MVGGDVRLFPPLERHHPVINALIHKDYSSGNPIQIRVETNSLRIFNAGPLPPRWTAQTLLETHTSQPFNPDIASTFFRTGLIEAWGRGYERIVNACREAGTPAPTVESDGNGVWLKWNWVNPASDAEAIRPVTPPTGDQVAGQVTGQVTGQVDRLLALMADEMTRDAMQTALGLAGRANFVVQYLKPALEAGLIEMTIPDKPNSRLQRYRLTPDGKARLAMRAGGRK